MKSFFKNTMIISVSVSALLGIMVILFGTIGTYEWRILCTMFLVFVYSIIANSNVNLLEKNHDSIIARIGLFATLIVFFVYVFSLWDIFEFWNLGEFFIKTISTLNIISISSIHLSTTILLRDDKNFDTLKNLLLILIILSYTYIIGLTWGFVEFDFSSFLFRLFMINCILTCVGTILLPIMLKLTVNKEKNIYSCNNENQDIYLQQLVNQSNNMLNKKTIKTENTNEKSIENNLTNNEPLLNEIDQNFNNNSIVIGNVEKDNNNI